MIFTAAVLTISDRASSGIYEDESGKVLVKLLEEMDFELRDYQIIADDYSDIKDKLIQYSDENIHLIITSGGTGLSKRDVTVDASLAVIEKEVSGISEMMRACGAKITPFAYLSRSVSGIRKNSLIINFPGSPKACKENFDIIRPILIHALETINGIKNH